jgi:cytochrome c oxidase assembly factor CtaG
VDLTAVYLLFLPAALYMRAARVLRRRGYTVPPLQQACWFTGLTMIGIALLSPLDHLGETDLVSAHMAQHLLLGDIAAPLLVLGLRTPVYAFVLPRPVLVPIARSKPLRRLLRFLTRPWVAAPLWILILYGWHLAPSYDAALRYPLLHALQHQSFLIGSLLVWYPVLQPTRRRVPGELWKIAHIGGVRFAGMFLGFALIAITHPIYSGFYGDRALEHGLSPYQDQQLAGGMMMGLDLIVAMSALLFFFMRSAEDAERAQRIDDARLADAGVLSTLPTLDGSPSRMTSGSFGGRDGGI